MSYKLDTRDSKWLKTNDMPRVVGPGSYEGANTTQNTWNRVASRGSDGGVPRTSIYGESDFRSSNNVPFNSKIHREDYDRLNRKFNPGPGAYANIQKNTGFKYDFITKQNVAERKIFSQELGQRSNKGNIGIAEQGLSLDAYGNPSYTIKDGGTLKKKMQPYAADKIGRDGLNIDKERLT
jgi:hypothetical protein